VAQLFTENKYNPLAAQAAGSPQEWCLGPESNPNLSGKSCSSNKLSQIRSHSNKRIKQLNVSRSGHASFRWVNGPWKWCLGPESNRHDPFKVEGF